MTLLHAAGRPTSRRLSRLRDWLPGRAQPRGASPPEPLPQLDGLALWSRFKRLTLLSWPRRFPIVQFPNAPLIIAFVAGQVAGRTHGAGHADASAVSYLAMFLWAYEELFQGVNWFRNLLGLAYVVSTGVHLALALHH
jgi:hypothetical protein